VGEISETRASRVITLTRVVQSRIVRESDSLRDLGTCILEAREILEVLLGLGNYYLNGSERKEGSRYEGSHSDHIST
jgi:hypothetical protein